MYLCVSGIELPLSKSFYWILKMFQQCIIFVCHLGNNNGSEFHQHRQYSRADPGFQVRGIALKKIAPSGGRCENFGGISCEKSQFYAKKIIFFSNFRGGGHAPGAPPLESAPVLGIKWTHQYYFTLCMKTKRTIKNGQFRDTIGQNTQNEDTQN